MQDSELRLECMNLGGYKPLTPLIRVRGQMNGLGRWQSALSSLYKWTVSSLPLPDTRK